MRSCFFWSLLLTALCPAVAWAQRPPVPAACTCRQNFDQVGRLLEANYAGYRDKVTPATRPRLDSLTAALRPRADTARAGTCWRVLQQWLAFFHDGHLSLQDDHAPRVNADSIRALFAHAPRLPWTRASFRAYLDDPARPKQPLEGTWRDADNGYEVGLVATGAGQYSGVVLRADSVWWLPGQVKFTLTTPALGPGEATYYMRNHAPEAHRVTAPAEGTLAIRGPWYRTYPRPVPVPAAPARFSFQMLDDTTALYRIASFDGRYRPRIDSLTRANAALLRRTRLLVLDLRDNGGGSDASYRSLTPYLYTRPVQEVGAQLWSTPANNRRYGGQLFPNMSWVEKIYFSRLQRRLDAHLNQFVDQRAHQKTVATKRLRRRRQHPEVTRVAVLQNRNCGSTTEQFLLEARQSTKVTLFGENSAGVLDYANVNYAALPCHNLRLGWATSRSHRIARGEGIDGVGLAPTVRLDPAASDLVEQVRAWYRTRDRR